MSQKKTDLGVIDIQNILEAMRGDGIANRRGNLHMVVLLLSLSAVHVVTEKPDHSIVPGILLLIGETYRNSSGLCFYSLRGGRRPC